MCLTIDVKKHGNSFFVAEKSIYTLKLATNYVVLEPKLAHVKSYFYEYMQSLGRKLTSPLRNSNGEVSHGLHSLYKPLKFFEIRAVEEDCVVLCVIPKGAKYYIGIDGDIVSDKLILKEMLVDNNSLPDYELKKYEVLKASFNSTRDMLRKAIEICDSYNIKIGL